MEYKHKVEGTDDSNSPSVPSNQAKGVEEKIFCAIEGLRSLERYPDGKKKNAPIAEEDGKQHPPKKITFIDLKG